MSSERAPLFEEDDDDLDVQDFKPALHPASRPASEVQALRESAERRGFASREAAPAVTPAPEARPIASLRRRRTGRDKQLNLKTTEDTLSRFYALADGNGWGLGETFERAVELLETHLRAESQ